MAHQPVVNVRFTSDTESVFERVFGFKFEGTNNNDWVIYYNSYGGKFKPLCPNVLRKVVPTHNEGKKLYEELVKGYTWCINLGADYTFDVSEVLYNMRNPAKVYTKLGAEIAVLGALVLGGIRWLISKAK